MWSLSFHPDGHTLASAATDGVRIWDISTAAPRERRALNDGGWTVRFSPDGRTLFTGVESGNLWQTAGDAYRGPTPLPGHSRGPIGAAFSHDGSLLATGSFQPNLRIFAREGLIYRPRAALEPDDWLKSVDSLGFSPDGSLLAAGRRGGHRWLRLWRVEGTKLEELLIPKIDARQLAFSPDGLTLAYADSGQDIHLLDLSRALLAERAVLQGHGLPGAPQVVCDLAFDLTGERLVSSGQDWRVILWNTADGTKVAQWLFHGAVEAVAFANDGRHLAVGNANGTIYILRVSSSDGGRRR